MVLPALAGVGSRVATALASRPLASFLTGTAVGDAVGGVLDAVPFIGGGGGGGNGQLQQNVQLALLLAGVFGFVAFVSKFAEEVF